MDPHDLLTAPLPGADLVARGIADLNRNIESIEALLVAIGRPRLARLGLVLPKRYDRPEIDCTSDSPPKTPIPPTAATTR
jgi:hypothetical protein